MKKTLSSLLLAIIFSLGLPMSPFESGAMMQGLTPDQRLEAIKYGKRGARTDVSEFVKEWSVTLTGKTKGFSFITTEFLALAYAARQAAMQSVELNNFDIEDTLAKSIGKLVFRATLVGDSQEFSQEYTAAIVVGEKTIPTTFWNNPMAETYDDGKKKPTFVADIDFFFPAEGVDPMAKLTLIIKDKAGKKVARFPYDLSKLR